MKAIVTGMIATYPVGGVVWDYAQYALGLENLGFEVYYLEDTGWQTYDPVRGAYGEDYTYGVHFLKKSLADLSPSLGNRWHVKAMDGKSFGIDAACFEKIASHADLFLNVSGSALLRDAYMPCKHKVLIDSDPGWNHFVNYPKWDQNPGWQGAHGYRAHDHFFTYAEKIGHPACILPALGISWRPTRPVVVPDRWLPMPPAKTWTTVMTWNNFRRPIECDGITYGAKEMEFDKIEMLPKRQSAMSFELAVGGDDAPVAHWRTLGWQVQDGPSVSATHRDYRDYIQRSRGEFSVAKNVYVATRSGWFSCRSICYLAAGRPVVAQDTGFSEIIPTGKGLFAFSNAQEAEAGLIAAESDYASHQQAARELAREYFGADRVLVKLLEEIDLR